MPVPTQSDALNRPHISCVQDVFIPTFYLSTTCVVHVVGPCHHGMARPQVADKGTASDKKGSCEYIE